MESIFNLDNQNSNLDSKIVAGLVRVSEVFKTLLLEKSKKYQLSPIQIQLLIFIGYHDKDKSTISHLAKEFNLSKPTISDTIKLLEQKLYITKNFDKNDSRSYTINLTSTGKRIVLETENFIDPLTEIIKNSASNKKLILWESITNIIKQLNELEIISVQRTCLKCKFYSKKNNQAFCSLLNQNLKIEDIRIDCSDFK
jgi:DNA-binding MarR family transcriptional regulator